MLVKFEQNPYGPNDTKFWPFWQKKKKKKKKKRFFFNHFWQSVDAIFEVVSAAETIVSC